MDSVQQYKKNVPINIDLETSRFPSGRHFVVVYYIYRNIFMWMHGIRIRIVKTPVMLHSVHYFTLVNLAYEKTHYVFDKVLVIPISTF